MKYVVDVKDISYGTIEVEADSLEQAEGKAHLTQKIQRHLPVIPDLILPVYQKSCEKFHCGNDGCAQQAFCCGRKPCALQQPQ